MNVEDNIGCKLYTILGETKLQGRSFKGETNWVLLSMDGKLSSTGFSKKWNLQIFFGDLHLYLTRGSL